MTRSNTRLAYRKREREEEEREREREKEIGKKRERETERDLFVALDLPYVSPRRRQV